MGGWTVYTFAYLIVISEEEHRRAEDEDEGEEEKGEVVKAEQGDEVDKVDKI